MIPPRPLPLAPRPFSDESVRSWIGRVAARYDLEPMELIARLRGGAGVEASRISSLDWSVDAELEILLAHAARLDRSQISALRILARGIPFPATRHRRLVAWCSACVSEDVGRYGEIYERAAWRLGCCVACSTHRLLLEEACLCVYGGCRYRPVAGRLRLVCRLCRRPADELQTSLPSADALAVRRRELPPGFTFDLQTDLLGAMTGAVPTGPWRTDGSGSQFAVMVRDLAAAILWPTWFEFPMNEDPSARSRHHHLFPELGLRTSLEVLGTIAAVLSATAGEGSTGTLSVTVKGDGSSADPMKFVRTLPAAVRRWLGAASREWPPTTLAGIVGHAVDIEEKRICDANSARDLADRNAAWARDAAPRLRAAAINRIAARARRVAVARTVRKEQGRGVAMPTGSQVGLIGKRGSVL
jgi:hypothetical protein